jgi:hypothetical protein
LSEYKQLHIWLHATSLQNLNREVVQFLQPTRNSQGEWNTIINQFQVLRDGGMWYFIATYQVVVEGVREG